MKKVLFFILLLGLILRHYGIEWDGGFHLHPDERALIMVADKLHFWDQLNPNFFNYGSLPIYLLKGTSQLLDRLFGGQHATYDGMLSVGRWLSIIFDLGTLLVVYQIAIKLFKNTLSGLFASFLYAISFFPIQNTHFFVVDVYLTFFITALLYSLLCYLEKPTVKHVLSVSLFVAAALATKITAVVFVPFTALVVIGGSLLTTEKPRHLDLIKTVLIVLVFLTATLLLHFLFMPYAYLDFSTFYQQTSTQTHMSRDPYIFPYTLQYVYTVPYLYYLKNIVLWGLGPVISVFSLVGIGLGLKKTFFDLKSLKEKNKNKSVMKFLSKVWFYLVENKLIVVFVLFYLLYFLIIGRSAVKFMRYMLPLYPFFIVLAGFGLEQIRRLSKLSAILLLVLATIWTVSFVSIYSVKHTRITATNWILQNIPQGSSIAVEHWDDRLPIMNSENYRIQDLTLYDLPDDEVKWSRINSVLTSSQYIIIASNRLYVPLQKLTDCTKYLKCYPLTAQYYQRLFDGTLGYQKVAEFRDDPKVPLLPFYISDQSADESFTVYDHPKIMIFKKM